MESARETLGPSADHQQRRLHSSRCELANRFARRSTHAAVTPITFLTDRVRAADWYFRLKHWRLAKTESPYGDFHTATNSIFIHIPKTGGMAVMKSLYGVERQLGHPPAIAYYSAHPETFRRAFVFTILREPVSRFRSAYSFLKAGGINPEDKAFGVANLRWDNLDEAVKSIDGEGLWPSLMRWKHFRPQCHFVAGPNNDKPYPIDFFGRQDRMQESVDVVCRTLELPQIKARIVNKTRRAASGELSDESREIISRVYRQDVQLWGRVIRQWPEELARLDAAAPKVSRL